MAAIFPGDGDGGVVVAARPRARYNVWHGVRHF